MQIDNNALNNASKWLSYNISQDIKDQINKMQKEDIALFNDSFYTDLEFGTGGLRGIMGIGTNRMNNIVVAMTTQGFVNYILQSFKNDNISVAISMDSRVNSKDFAMITAKVFAANGIKVFIFEDIHPTPLLSFAVRFLGCKAGVMLTASHNPKQYNGYKAYWSDGGQLVPPDDTNVIEAVRKIKDYSEVKIQDSLDNIEFLKEDFDLHYLRALDSLSLSTAHLDTFKNIRIAYSPLHGTGYKLMPKALKRWGFNNVFCEPQQSIPDGTFPTCLSPNPEEKVALQKVLDLAEKENCDIALASDPDADREAFCVKDTQKQWHLLNGNQTASLLTYYILLRNQELNRLNGKQYMIKTIVTTDLISKICESFSVKYYNVLTGFKWIASKVLELEGKQQYIGGGEESYGYMPSDLVRDKDSIATCCLLCELTSWAKQQGINVYDLLLDIYKKYGYYQESLLSIVRTGQEGKKQIADMMDMFRNNPPQTIIDQKIIHINDYQKSIAYDTIKQKNSTLDLPKSNVLQYFLQDGSKISIRPSGTEPKIKFYFSIKCDFKVYDDFDSLQKKAFDKIENIKQELNLN